MNISQTEISDLNNLVNKLEDFRKEITNIDYIHKKSEFFEIMKEFRSYLLSIENKQLHETFFHSKYFKLYKDFFTDINQYYLRSIESLQSISIMTKWIHNFDNFASLIDKEIVKLSFDIKANELKHIDFSGAKTLVAVWCWAMPETLLYIYENTNIENIIWVDYNHEAIFMAWEMVSWLNIDKITFHRGDGMYYDYSNADIVYIPAFTYPKDKILDRIAETWKDNVQIIVAVPKWLWNIIFEDIWQINQRLKISNREDLSTSFLAQEIVKLEKYDF